MLPRIGDFVEAVSFTPVLLTEGHFKLEGRDERLGVLHGVIDGDAGAGRVHEGVNGIEVDELRADVFEGEQVALLPVALEHALHAEGEVRRIWPGFRR